MCDEKIKKVPKKYQDIQQGIAERGNLWYDDISQCEIPRNVIFFVNYPLRLIMQKLKMFFYSSVRSSSKTCVQ